MSATRTTISMRPRDLRQAAAAALTLVVLLRDDPTALATMTSQVPPLPGRENPGSGPIWKSQHRLQCDIVSAPPERHGAFRKEGILPPKLWFQGLKDNAERTFNAYLKLNASLVEAAGAPPLPARAGCHHLLLINDHYHLIFIKSTKTAGTSLLKAFHKLGGYLYRPVPVNGINSSMRMTVVDKLGQSCPTCLRHANTEEEASLQAKFRDYFVLTVARNPFDRAVSSYEYLLRLRQRHWRRSDQKRAARCKAPSFQEFCQRPYVIGLQDREKGCYTQEEKLRAQLPLGEQHDFVHVEPLAQCLLTEGGRPAFDYALRMDSLQADFEDMRLNHLNSRERLARGVPPFPQLSIGWSRKPAARSGQQQVSMSRHMRRFKRCKTCLASVVDYYRDDFELFGYPKTEAECMAVQPPVDYTWSQDSL